METNTIIKIDLSVIKNDIKKLSEEQKVLRNFRKTVNFKGSKEERNIMEPNEATYKHSTNRRKLRIMYAAYGLMRGKTFDQIEKQKDTNGEHPLEMFMFDINKVIKKYSIEK